MALCVGLLFSIFYFLFSREASAWGPIAHIDYAHEALRHVATYGSMVKTLLEACPKDFLYGSLAADITLGKDYVDYVHNCHNWRVGFLIFQEAQENGDERQQAAALGYLAHLAVDVVSHNYFVPYKTIRSWSTRTLGHLYWEVRFDAKRPKAMWNLARDISKIDFSHNDRLFEKMVRKTIFSFKTNRKIFRSVLNLHRLKHWHMMIEKVHEKSRFPFPDEHIAEYRGLAIDSMVSFLRHPETAPCTKVDPTGEAKLLYAEELRAEFKNRWKKKQMSEIQADEALRKVKAALKSTIFKPGILPTPSELFASR